MVNLLVVVIATTVITIIGGGFGYFIWLMTRAKKMYWKANVYQLSDGVQAGIKDKFGNIVSDVHLKDMRPYTKDVIEKVFKKKSGMTIFRLQKLDKTVDGVPSHTVDHWGEKNNEVDVLLEGETATVMSKGYDSKSGKIIFNPMPHDRINLIKSEQELKKNRLKNEKDILEAITPWVIAGICMFGLIAIAFIMVDGFTKISENILEGEEIIAETLGKKIDNLQSLLTGTVVIDTPTPTTRPESIDP